ncbi:UNVERIFIED_CONTAM: hypothetical protein HDU68_009823 [Siphonaria sp. JEL0065]|nr:hypothetical protein HDU68_009823 [Siphonaria sp. JEL0065]
MASSPVRNANAIPNNELENTGHAATVPITPQEVEGQQQAPYSSLLPEKAAVFGPIRSDEAFVQQPSEKANMLGVLAGPSVGRGASARGKDKMRLSERDQSSSSGKGGMFAVMGEEVVRHASRGEKSNSLFSEMNALQRAETTISSKEKDRKDVGISNDAYSGGGEGQSPDIGPNPVMWTVHEVSSWLKGESVSDEIVAKFTAQAINGQALLLLNLDNLKNDLDIEQLGIRIALLDLINSIKGGREALEMTEDPPAYS